MLYTILEKKSQNGEALNIWIKLANICVGAE